MRLQHSAGGDRATLATIDVQCCRNCGARLWRRTPNGPEPYMPGIPVGTDCPGSTGEMTVAKKTKPKAQALPGLGDRAIKDLEEAAEAYADIRDQRQALNLDESKLKTSVLNLMKKHGKTIYQRNGITITVVAEEETVKVRVRKGNEDDDEDGRSDE